MDVAIEYERFLMGPDVLRFVDDGDDTRRQAALIQFWHRVFTFRSKRDVPTARQQIGQNAPIVLLLWCR
jgi:hypothetical protein